MRIAILHYHMRQGGVARVIAHTRSALALRGHDVLVASGEPGEQVDAVVPALRYGAPASEEHSLRLEVATACRSRWHAEPDVLHVHNHALGKNLSLPFAVAAWALEGRAMVLQAHDFAENGRPANHRLLRNGGALPQLYPCSDRIALAVLTTHARSALSKAGGSSTIVPNPVVPPLATSPVDPSRLGAGRLIVYPTRAIRRKNLGEFLLLAAQAPTGTVFAVSGAPASPDPDYELWQRTAAELGLPVRLNACAHLQCSLGDLLAGAHLAVTTSIEEGFGLAFFEPPAAGIPVWGRSLPHVEDDLLALDIGPLYTRFEVPSSLLDLPAVSASVSHAVDRARAAYGLAPDADSLAQALQAVLSPQGADFGRLPETLQRPLLAQARSIPPPSPGPSCLRSPSPATITTRFSPAQTAASLESLYHRVADSRSTPPEWLDPQRILLSLLDFSDFSALRFQGG
jgi:glycosyltransferase involved in cell wall biosynthesis